MTTLKPLIALALIATLSLPAAGAVRDQRDDAFRTESVVLVKARPATTWRELIRVSGWWDPSHTWSGSARRLRLDPRAGGCFCERLEAGGSVEHARVVFVQPARVLRLQGALGPLQEMPVTGVLTFTLAPDGPGTRVTMTFQASGSFTTEVARLAPIVDSVLETQLGRLRDHVNAGK